MLVKSQSITFVTSDNICKHWIYIIKGKCIQEYASTQFPQVVDSYGLVPSYVLLVAAGLNSVSYGKLGPQFNKMQKVHRQKECTMMNT